MLVYFSMAIFAFAAVVDCCCCCVRRAMMSLAWQLLLQCHDVVSADDSYGETMMMTMMLLSKTQRERIGTL